MIKLKLVAIALAIVAAFVGLNLHGEVNEEGFAVVLAPSGLVVRNKPSTTGKKVALLPFGTVVRLTGAGDTVDTIDGITRPWWEIKAGGKKGFAFGGYLQVGLPLTSSSFGEYQSFGDLLGLGMTFLEPVMDEAASAIKGKCEIIDETGFISMRCGGKKVAKWESGGEGVNHKIIGGNESYIIYEVYNNGIGCEIYGPEDFPGGNNSPEYKQHLEEYEGCMNAIEVIDMFLAKNRGLWAVNLKTGNSWRAVPYGEALNSPPLAVFFPKHNVIYCLMGIWDQKKQQNSFRELLYDVAGKKAAEL